MYESDVVRIRNIVQPSQTILVLNFSNLESVLISVADPGYLSHITDQYFSIPDTGQKGTGFLCRIRLGNEWSRVCLIKTRKKKIRSSPNCDPGCLFLILDSGSGFFFPSGSGCRTQGSGSVILDPQQ
jgi:hypothetical protein